MHKIPWSNNILFSHLEFCLIKSSLLITKFILPLLPKNQRIEQCKTMNSGGWRNSATVQVFALHAAHEGLFSAPIETPVSAKCDPWIRRHR